MNKIIVPVKDKKFFMEFLKDCPSCDNGRSCTREFLEDKVVVKCKTLNHSYNIKYDPTA